ncbi:MAG TPA: SPOR domain-containing protein [Microbacteriaceae bacterium]|nr:SPOR domain-containing protein [Microbacteriaceae bacterium]
MSDERRQFWYNSRTGEVEEGVLSPSAYRVGPFATRDAATHAPDLLRENARRWREEDEAED